MGKTQLPCLLGPSCFLPSGLVSNMPGYVDAVDRPRSGCYARNILHGLHYLRRADHRQERDHAGGRGLARRSSGGAG